MLFFAYVWAAGFPGFPWSKGTLSMLTSLKEIQSYNLPGTAGQDCHFSAMSQVFPSNSALLQNPQDRPL